MISFFVLMRQLTLSFRRALKEKEFRGLLFMVLLLLSIGVSFYMQVEGWRFVDAFYFCVMTLTTVGYGDVTPEKDVSKIFTSFYVLLGIGIIVAFVNIVAKHGLEGYQARQAEIEKRRRAIKHKSEASTDEP